MELNWGLYCRTCGESSDGWFEELPELVDAVRRTLPGQGEADGVTEAGPADEFLARHAGHELWAESEGGVLQLSPARPQSTDSSRLPKRFLRATRSGSW